MREREPQAVDADRHRLGQVARAEPARDGRGRRVGEEHHEPDDRLQHGRGDPERRRAESTPRCPTSAESTIRKSGSAIERAERGNRETKDVAVQRSARARHPRAYEDRRARHPSAITMRSRRPIRPRAGGARRAGAYPGTHDRCPPFGTRARRAQCRDPPAGRPVPPRQRRVARTHRDPRRQGPLGLVPPHRRAGREGRPRDRRRVAGRRARHRGAQDRRPVHELHGHRAHRRARRARRSPSSSPASTRSTRSRRSCAPSASSSATASAARSHLLTSSPTRATRALRAVPHPGRAVAARRELLPARELRRRRAPRSARTSRRCSSSRACRTRRHPPIASSTLETELATHHWDNVKSRDAVATYNLKTWDEVQALAGVDLRPWLEGHRARPRRRVRRGRTCTSRASSRASARCWPRSGSRTGRRGCASRSSTRAPPFLSDDFVDENFAFYGTQLTGRAGQPRALEARRRPGRGGDGRGDRPRLRRAALPAGREGRDGRARRQPHRGVPAVDRRARVDEPPRPASARSRSSTRSRPRSATR